MEENVRFCVQREVFSPVAVIFRDVVDVWLVAAGVMVVPVVVAIKVVVVVAVVVVVVVVVVVTGIVAMDVVMVVAAVVDVEVVVKPSNFFFITLTVSVPFLPLLFLRTFPVLQTP